MVAAAPMPVAIMKDRELRFWAIWWAASWYLPIQPTMMAAKLNAVTSSRFCSDMGRESLSWRSISRRCTARCGVSLTNLRYSSTRKRMIRKAIAPSTLDISVDQAAPATPKAGAPSFP